MYTLTNGSTVTGTGNLQTANNGTLTVTGSSTIGCANFTLTNGFLDGSGTTTVTGALSWSNTSMLGSGVTNLRGNSTVSGVGLSLRTLNNFGTVTETGAFTFFNAGVLNNEGSATWTLTGSAQRQRQRHAQQPRRPDLELDAWSHLHDRRTVQQHRQRERH